VITITVVQQGQRIRFAHAFRAEIDWRIIVVGNGAGLVISRIEGYRTIRGTITTPVSRGITENRVAFTGRVATSIQALWNIPWDIITVDLALEVSFCRRTAVEVDQGLFQCQPGMSMRDG
jgi:4-hydroxy-3-methylbut-2-en-1-yl diphosphate synthase IspG/GcpE